MFSNPFQTEDSNLHEAIASAFADLKNFSANDEGYQAATDQLVKLYKLKHDQSKLNLELHVADNKILLDEANAEFEREQTTKPFYMRVDPNTALVVLGNLAVGLIVVKYEQTGVISSKVMSFMKKI